MTSSAALPPPLVPADVDLRDFRFMPLDVVRLLDSDVFGIGSPEAFRAAVASWCRSWHQVPASSLPNNDPALCRLLGYGRAVDQWVEVREQGALHGWISCNDERLYHPVVAEKALESWIKKLLARRSGAAGNAKRHKHDFDARPFDEALAQSGILLRELAPTSTSLASLASLGIRLPNRVATGSRQAPDEGRDRRSVRVAVASKGKGHPLPIQGATSLSGRTVEGEQHPDDADGPF